MNVRVYTDGSCRGNPGSGGWAVVILLPDRKIELAGSEEKVTSNRMELKAVLEAVRYTKELDYKKILIYCDSAYVINPLNKGWLKKWSINGWKTVAQTEVRNLDLWQQLDEILKDTPKKEFNFIKIKGHNGDKNNDYADKLAKQQTKC